jgi:hypothetical protein
MVFKKSDLMETINKAVAEDLEYNHVTDASPEVDKFEMTELVDIDLALIGSDDEVSTPTDVTSNTTTDAHIDAVTQQNGKSRTNAQFGQMALANTLMEAAEAIKNKIFEDYK